MFANLRVVTRLGLGFGLLILMLLGTALFGLSRLDAVADTNARLMHEQYPRINDTRDLVDHYDTTRVLVRDLLLLSDAAQLDATYRALASNREQMRQRLQQLDQAVRDEETRAALQVLLTHLRSTATVVDEIVALSRSDRAAAIAHLERHFLPVQQNMLKELHHLTTLMEAQMQRSSAQARDVAADAHQVLLATMAAAIVLAALVAWVIARGIVRLLGGEPAYAAALMHRIAQGDLRLQVQTRKNDRSSMLHAVQTMVHKLQQMVGEIHGSAEALASASEQVSATAQSLSQASSEQAASVEQISSTIDQAHASVRQNSDNARQTDAMAATAALDAREGGEAVKATVAAMQQIAQKIGIVDDIAYQTNLLALNAAIEAARAGEHGRGFAVVAAEVRKLAERSQVAAQEIGEVAAASVAQAERAGGLLALMVPNIQKTSVLVQQIAGASGEQSAGITQINTAMAQLSQVTQINASSSEELAATSEEMSAQAEQLQQTVGFFLLDAAPPAAPRLAPARMVAGHAPAARRARTAAQAPDESHFVNF